MWPLTNENNDAEMLLQIIQVEKRHQEWVGELAQRFAPLDGTVQKWLGSFERLAKRWLDLLKTAYFENYGYLSADIDGVKLFEATYHNRFWNDDHFLITDRRLGELTLLKLELYLSSQLRFFKKCLKKMRHPEISTILEERIKLKEVENWKLGQMRLKDRAGIKASPGLGTAQTLFS